MLTFAFANMLKNPETYFAAQQEVDRVIGRDKIRPQHLGQLKYVDAMLKETLRLNPTAPAYVRGVRPENKEENPSIGCGKYAMPEHGGILCLLTRIHRDPKIWGNDAHEFKPERMLDWNFEKLPQAAWKPFGTGLRACIGRAFAWQEALLACALILQNFNMSLDDPNYQMKIVQTLAIKPKDFYMRAKLRPGVTAASLQSSFTLGKDNVTEDDTIVPEDKHEAGSNENLKILYGSNTGTCESLARKLASQAGQYGYRAGITDLDSAIEHVPTDMPVAIITASYEGQPCDNAARFTTWLQTLNNTNQLKGVKYAAFGVGHSDWRDTFQRQPKLIDAKFAELGAARLTECCGADVSKNNLFADFETWTEKSFWPSLPQPEGDIHRPQSPKRVISTLKLAVKSEDRAALLQQRLQWAKVLDTKQLTPPGRPQKRHIEIGLAEGVTYQVGDYLAILPINHEDSVKRVMRQFKLNIESIITIADAGPTTLPTNIPMHVDDLLKGYVELAQPATPRDIQSLAVKASSASEKAKLEDLNEQSIYEATILQHRISVLDLLEQYPSIELSLDQFLTMLPPLQPRHYSISSSPLQHPKSCTLTYSVIDAPTLSGLGDRFQGVSSTYLQNLKKGDDVLVSVRSTNKLFRLPTDPEHTPIMMFCAGSGIAPFRGFVEERAYLIQEGKRKLAPALLFVGFRSNDEDALYAEELVEWSKIGAVDVRYAFSQSPADSEGCKHVQDRMLHDREDVVEMFGKGAMVYICGSRKVAQELGVAARELVNWKAEKESKVLDPALVEIFITTWRNSRFVSDVFT
jgi:cytochrome P450/NADPH-cytochrome P450 reductase